MEEIQNKISSYLSVEPTEAQIIINKAIAGGETTEEGLASWYENRFLPNTVFIDEDGYAEMCIDALKIIGTTVASDYGSSRQRDFGQMWADMTRGYLGELAFKLFLKEKHGIDIELGHERGELADYLPSDIHMVKREGKKAESPKISVGIKATKWNGIWLDIPGDQFNHSDAHIFIKVGTGRDHLFAYFKKISVFKDKVLKVGKDMGSLSEGEADTLYNNLPTFRPVPAYICGFALRDNTYKLLDYTGRKGRLHFKVATWNGPMLPDDLDKIKAKEGTSGGGKVEFEGIGKFSHERMHLFNAGNLKWKREDWKKLVGKL